jgi:DNA-binding response OmpR family regulator
LHGDTADAEPEGDIMTWKAIRNGSGVGVLLVDGDDCIRILVREYLEANGFEVKDTALASEALRLAGSWGGGHPKILVTAVHLPDASGAWLAGLLRRRDRPGMAVVYLVIDDLNVETLSGDDRHVQKPFSFLQLHAAINDALVAKVPDMPNHWASPRYPAPWFGYGSVG